MSDPKPCPRCGSDEISYGYSSPPFQGHVCCHADGCEIIAIGDTEAGAIQLWNSGQWDYRATEHDDNGNQKWLPDGPEASHDRT